MKQDVRETLLSLLRIPLTHISRPSRIQSVACGVSDTKEGKHWTNLQIMHEVRERPIGKG